jgi:hypothetical protein
MGLDDCRPLSATVRLKLRATEVGEDKRGSPIVVVPASSESIGERYSPVTERVPIYRLAYDEEYSLDVSRLASETTLSEDAIAVLQARLQGVTHSRQQEYLGRNSQETWDQRRVCAAERQIERKIGELRPLMITHRRSGLSAGNAVQERLGTGRLVWAFPENLQKH